MIGAQVFRPLSVRPFRLLWFAATASAVGSAFVPVALTFSVLRVGGSPTSLGFVLMAGTASGIASSLIGGVWADRISRRKVMLAADLMRFAVEASIASLLLTGRANTWELGGAYALVAIASAFFRPASTGFIADVVATDQLQSANSLLSVTMSASAIFGPALSGVLIATVGPGCSFAVDSASFAVSAVFLGFVKVSGQATPGRNRFLTDLSAGWREVVTRSWAWTALTSSAIGNMAWGVFLVVGPIEALNHLGGASGWGLVSSGLSVGAVLGGLVSFWVKPNRPIADGILATMLMALPLFAVSGGLPVYLIVACAIMGMSGTIFSNTNWATAVQQLIPNEMLSRFRSYDYLVAATAMPVGYATAGPLVASMGADQCLILAGSIIVLSASIPAALPSVRRIVRTADGSIIESTGARISSRAISQ